jgi:DNA sulfur modification protein DndC
MSSATLSDPTNFKEIVKDLRALYLADSRPWLIGFSGGKDSTLVGALVFEAVRSVTPEQRKKEIHVVCTDTRVEIPAIVEMVEGTLARMRKFSQEHSLNVEVHLLRPSAEQSFWVNIIGRGYPPPNRVFRWCTQRLKIDPVTRFVESRMGRWQEAVLLLGARRAESASRAQTLAARDTRNGLSKHPDLPRVWVSNPIQFLTTEEVWAYLLQNPPPWGGDNRALYKLYSQAGGGECPIQIDTSTPACGNSRFGCWTCTVVDRDKASEGLLESGDDRMEHLLDFRETLLEFRDPSKGWRDGRRMNGNEGPGPLTIEGRRELLKRLVTLQEETGLKLISDEELLLIQQMWKIARDPDDGRGVARIVNRIRGTRMTDLKETSQLQKLQEEVCKEKKLSPDILRRLLATTEQFTDSHRAFGLSGELLRIINDDLHEREFSEKE